MNAQHTEADHLEARGIALSLAARLAAYPDERVASVAAELKAVRAGEPTERLAETMAGITLEELQAEYLALFDAGQNRCPIHETEYGRMRGMSKGNELADLAGFYNAFGLVIRDDQPEMPDHLAVELEFYAVLLAKQLALSELGDAEGQAIVEDARRKFLVDHLGRLAPALASQPAVRAHPIYRDVFETVGALVQEECAALGAQPAPLEFFPVAPGREGEESCCGAVPDGVFPTRPFAPGAPTPPKAE